jgi:hypothetical protein
MPARRYSTQARPEYLSHTFCMIAERVTLVLGVVAVETRVDPGTEDKYCSFSLGNHLIIGEASFRLLPGLT